MSRFFSDKYIDLEPYVPGEQLKDRRYIKLNTNESPFPPSEAVVSAVTAELNSLQLYSDPECLDVIRQCANLFGVRCDQIVMTNGSDEVLNFAFMAFCDEKHPIAFPDITYGFYPVFAKLNGVPYKEIPLTGDLRIDYKDYLNIGCNIVIANPNAPTGIALSLDEIEEIVKTNKDHVVIIDEAYVDFGAESAVSLVDKYDNLLVTQTFSKSRSMAGARLGFGIGSADIIRDLNTIRYSTNPYNVNRMTIAAGAAALRDNGYYMDNCHKIIDNREHTIQGLRGLGFDVLDSKSNFVFAKHRTKSGAEIYTELKKNGILVRYFNKPRINEYVRITIGTREQMDTLLDVIKGVVQ